MDTDYQRTERQRKVVELAFEKAKKADPKTLNDLLGNVLSMVATNLTWQDGLDVINDIGKYKLVDTQGFPFKKDDMTKGTKGFIVVPIDLESNVVQLHSYLFKDENYEASAKVKAYSERISEDTGFYKDGDKVKRVKTNDGYKSNKSYNDDEDETKSKKKKSTTEEETKKSKSVDVYTDNNGRYYQLDKDGETVWIDKNDGEDYYTDGAGNKYYMQPEEKESTHKEKSNKSKSTAEAPAESTQANKGSSVEIVEPHTKKETAETETAAPKKKPNGPGETTTAKATEEKPKGPGETKATKESTVEPVPTTADRKEETVPPVPTAQTVEPKPE